MKKFRLIVEDDGATYGEKITCAEDAAKVLAPYFKETDQEHFYVLAVNQGNLPIGVFHLSTGGITQTVVDPKVLFSRLLAVPTCVSFICAHNHPSGQLKASNADIELTKRLEKAAEMLDFRLLDHIIFTEDSFLSLANEGLI